MRVNWVAYNTIAMKSGAMYSHFASARYRVIQPMIGLSALGHEVRLIQMGHDAHVEDLIGQFDGDVVVFSKLIAPQRNLFESVAAIRRTLIERLQSIGRTVIADINDDYFDHEFYGAAFREVVQQANGVVTSTPQMQSIVAKHTSRPSFVVTDAFEGPHGEPAFCPPERSRGWMRNWLAPSRTSEPLRLVWFGHQSNWSSMQEATAELLEVGVAIELELITAPGCGVEAYCDQFNARHRRRAHLRFTPWSPGATWAGLARAAVVLLPSRPDEPGKAVKSPNRLVETLRAGRYAVVDPLPSYLPFADYCHVGGTTRAALAAAIEQPDQVRSRVARGQAYVEAEFSPAAVSSAWERVLRKVAG